MILIFFATQWRGVVYASGGYPIMGATVNVRDRHTKRYLATAATDPEGRFDFGGYETVYAGGDYTLEVINGSEKVTIWGDSPFEVDVVTPEMARERRRQEAEASLKADAGVRNWPLDGWRSDLLFAWHWLRDRHRYSWSEQSGLGNRWRVCRCGWRHEVFGP